MEEQSYRLIIEYFEKTISDDGLTQLQEWVEESPENLAQFSETIQILQAAKLYLGQPQNTDQSWERIQAHINTSVNQKKEEVKPIHKWMYAAAVALVFGALGILLNKQVFNSTQQYVVINNANGKQSKILLPDSSSVYLAGGSTLKYPAKFENNKREVYLSGEAFFDVVHLGNKPFTVQSGKITTVVLGTSFNIKAYTTENKISITVKTGKVGVMANAAGKNQLISYLTPNEQIEIDTQSGLYTSAKTDANAVTSWITHGLVFYNTPLKDIAASLERHYGVGIEFTDPDLKSIKLTAKFNNQSIVDVMDNISALSGISYTRKGNQIFLTNNNQRGGKVIMQ